MSRYCKHGIDPMHCAADECQPPAKGKAQGPLGAAACSVIRSTPEHGVGEQEMTFRMAANAIWNKLNFAMSLVEEDGQLMDLLSEARALADSIVRHPKSGSQNAELTHPETKP
jgi:hypothetical protein